jgi:hypothetical protein
MAKFIITSSYAIRKDKVVAMYVPDIHPKRLCIEIEGASQIYAIEFETREKLVDEYTRILKELEED